MDLENELRESLSRRADRISSTKEQSWAEIERRLPPPGRPGRGRMVVVVLALAVSGLTILWLRTVFSETGGNQNGAATSGPLESLVVDPHLAAKVDVGGDPTAIAVGETGTWVAVSRQDGSDKNELVRIDPATNEVAQRAELPFAVDALAARVDVWAVGAEVAGSPTLLHLTSLGEMVGSLDGVGAPLAIGDGVVWATGVDGSNFSLVEIDPQTMKTTASFSLPGYPWAIHLEGGSVWVLEGGTGNAEPGQLLKYDASGDGLVASFPVALSWPGFTVGSDGLWIAGTSEGQGAAAVQLDPATGEVIARAAVETTFRPIGVDVGGVWFLAGPGTEAGGSGVCRLNAQTLEVDDCVNPGSIAEPVQGAAVLDSNAESVWVGNNSTTVTRIDLTR